MTSAAILESATVPPTDANGDEALYEIVNGQRVELPPMSIYAVRTMSRLHGWLSGFVGAHSLGESIVECLFHLPLPQDRNRRPDLAFVSYDRWPRNRPMPEEENAWDVVPNLAVEVVSPSDFTEDLLEKVEEYFQAGVQLVWVVYPRRRTIHVYQSLTEIQGLTSADELDGGPVLPGFRLALAELFLELAAPEA